MVSVETSMDYGQGVEAELAAERAAQGNRRRLRVFAAVCCCALLAGLAFTFSRPAEYRAQARIAVRTAAVVAELPQLGARPASPTVSTAAHDGAADSLAGEAARLSSRPVIEAALAALREQGVELPEFGPDPLQGVQAALTAQPLPDSNLIELSAVGREPAHLAALVNALFAAYSKEIADNYAKTASSEGEALRQELDALNRRIADKRAALERFRERADIVSGDRGENEILARVKGLSASLNAANEKVAQAEGRVRSLRESIAAGKAAVRARDNPSLAGMEARASELRATLREQERAYTPQFMAMDPNVRAVRSRLADLEAQIAEQRAASGQTSLAEAEDELATARQAQRKLQAQIAEDRAAVHQFSRNFSIFESMQAELAQIEASRSSLSERLLRTETSEASRRPSVQIVEAATPPRDPWRPDYARDAGIAAALSVALGLLAMALVELFNRPPRPSTAPVIVTRPWLGLGQALRPALAVGPRWRALAGTAPEAARLPAAGARELTQDEVARLLQALPPADAAWAVMLLCGATPDEIRGLAAADLDAGGAAIRLQGAGARSLRLPAAWCATLAAAAADGQHAAVVDMPAADDELNRRLLCAAHDAGLEDPAGITPQTLRHTCIAYLVRQGLRFAELGRVVGALPADALAEYAALAPAGVRRSLDEIDALMPALQAPRGE